MESLCPVLQFFIKSRENHCVILWSTVLPSSAEGCGALCVVTAHHTGIISRAHEGELKTHGYHWSWSLVCICAEWLAMPMNANLQGQTQKNYCVVDNPNSFSGEPILLMEPCTWSAHRMIHREICEHAAATDMALRWGLGERMGPCVHNSFILLPQGGFSLPWLPNCTAHLQGLSISCCVAIFLFPGLPYPNPLWKECSPGLLAHHLEGTVCIFLTN